MRLQVARIVRVELFEDIEKEKQSSLHRALSKDNLAD